MLKLGDFTKRLWSTVTEQAAEKTAFFRPFFPPHMLVHSAPNQLGALAQVSAIAAAANLLLEPDTLEISPSKFEGLDS